MIAVIAVSVVTIILGLTFVRLLAGPTLYDRVIAANAMIVHLALICGALAAWRQSTLFADVAIALVFCLVTANVAVLKFFSARTFQPPLDLGAEGGAR